MSLRHLKVDLFRAIKIKDVEEIREILLNNPELLSDRDSKNNDDYSPLWKAMLAGYEDIVELLIREFGADPDEKCFIKTKLNLFDPYGHDKKYEGYTFIQFAASQKNNFISKYKVVKVLIRHGANVHAPLTGTKIGNPLQISLSNENLQFFEFLLQNGADLRQAKRFGESPAAFVFACPFEAIRKEMLLLLIKYGLDLSVINEEGQNILHLFLSFEEWFDDVVEISEILLNYGVSLDEVDDEGCTPLHCAISLQYPKIIPFLIKRGANVNARCKDDGRTPLMEAARGESKKRTKKIINLLLSRGAEINAQSKHGCTALYEACLHENEHVIRCLLQKGADTSLECVNGSTPFTSLTFGNDDPCKITMIKEFSKLDFEKLPFSKKDMNLLKSNSNYQKHFKNCKIELSRMKDTVFYPPYSYYTLMKMSKNIKKLSKLTKNSNFVKEFKKNLSFPYYESDLRRIFKKAVKRRKKLQVVDSRLYSIFGKVFPDIVLKKLADHLSVKDLPLE